jgi:thiamine biosynthesis lipoprotein
MQEIVFRAMGSEIYCAVDSSLPRIRTRLERVPAMFETWEKILSRFRRESELSQLNARSGETVRVSETLWRVLQLAAHAEIWSDGLVTPTVLNALERAGYDCSFEKIQNVSARSNAESKVQVAWELHKSAQMVTLVRGARLDLGGVAKGWAAEQTARYLGETGAALVDAGGDMVMTAPPRTGYWCIGIENPFAPEEDKSMPVLKITRGAVATSGRDFRKWMRGDTAAHHLIDPRTKQPAQTDVLTATVIASDIFHAEVAAKVILILGSAEGLSWLEMHAPLAAFVVLENGQVLTSKRMEQFVI